jgi:hypothetical protein
MERYAVIGSGVYMARAALSRKSISPNLNTVIYRVLGAKFSAETAAGVGKSTTVILLNSIGEDASMTKGVIDKVRDAWEKEISAPDPREALEAIDKSGAVGVVTKQQSY